MCQFFIVIVGLPPNYQEAPTTVTDGFFVLFDVGIWQRNFKLM